VQSPVVVRENAWKVVAMLAAIGGSVGWLNLVVAHVVRPGVYTLAYAGTVGLILLMAAVVAVRRRIGMPLMLATVLGGDLAYLACCVCVVDARLYATPLMLLFPTLVGAWYLPVRALAVHLVALPVLVGAVLYRPGTPLGAWLVQVTASTTMLTGAAVMVFVLAGKVRSLLESSQRLVYLDPLTGLLNRRGLSVQGEALRSRAVARERQVAALVIDIDHFKRLNDRFGHAAGDQVLAVVAEAVRQTIGPDDLAVRTGGEEFVVLRATPGQKDVEVTANRVHSAILDRARRTCPQWPVTVSIGTAMAPPAGEGQGNETLHVLIAQADRALYAAKEAGRNRVVHHSDPVWDEQPVI
jgi:diguanylate cyclase (GGDEF)-like protein